MTFLRLLLATLVSVSAAQNCMIEENLASQGTASQSGTIRSATLANDGDTRPAPNEGNISQCALLKKGDLPFPWWQIDLKDSSFTVSKLEIYATEPYFIVAVGNKIIGNSDDYVDFITDMFPCLDKKYEEETGRIDVFCNVRGRYVTIINDPLAGNLSLCEVEIYGNAFTNLALDKDTQQSSDAWKAVSSLAVDGEYSQIFSLRHGSAFAPLCTHTSEEVDRYPWWRVDLGNFFMVKSLNIYNRGERIESRLHDIEIRVGGEDIEKFATENKSPDETVGDVLFTKNALCASVYGDSLRAGKNEVPCIQPTLGQYVSIQIVRFCNSAACKRGRAHEKNILTLCEVEVFGQKIDFDLKDGEYLSVDKPMLTSFDNSEDHNDDDNQTLTNDTYLWLNIDLQATDIVYMIEMEPEIDLTDLKMPRVEIRVGNEPITSTYNNERFTKNQLCASRHKIFDKPKILCENPVIGRYVTFQIKQCRGDNCMDNEMTQYAINEINVWGISENTYKFAWNVAPFKPTSQNSGFSSLAVDKIIPEMNSDDDKCALTMARNYPWWRADLKGPHHVRYVSIHIPRSRSANITADTDLEVRLGNEDISDQEDDSLFTKNNVCTPAKTDSSETRFECASLDPGRYVSVQSKNNLITAQSLQLCEVEVFGCEV